MDLIPKNQEIEKGISNITQQALCLKVVDNKSYAQAGSMRNAHTDMKKTIIGFFKPHKDNAWKAHKALCKAETDELAKLSPAVKHLDTEMLAQEKIWEKEKLAEEERLREIARKEAEDQQMKDALEAEKEGNKEEAEAILNEEPHVPTPIVAPSTPKIAGLGTVTNWTHKVTDLKLLVKAICEGKVSVNAVKANETFLNQQARSLKDTVKIEGVEFFSVTTKRGVRK